MLVLRSRACRSPRERPLLPLRASAPPPQQPGSCCSLSNPSPRPEPATEEPGEFASSASRDSFTGLPSTGKANGSLEAATRTALASSQTRSEEEQLVEKHTNIAATGTTTNLIVTLLWKLYWKLALRETILETCFNCGEEGMFGPSSYMTILLFVHSLQNISLSVNDLMSVVFCVVKAVMEDTLSVHGATSVGVVL
nr:uncharacterized protein LOC127329217 [Lolium perenne]